MLYGYKFSFSQMNEIKNWKKKNKFEHKLLGVEELELKTFEVECVITYKKTVPLNLFEKYAIRLIQRSEDIHSSITMNVNQVAKMLHLDEKLVEENLSNLADIGMLNAVHSDMITINSDEYAEYLQYENKFKKEKMKKSFHLSSAECENIDNHLQGIFEKDSENRGKRFDSVDILEKKESIKNVYLLNYSDNNFLIYSNDGINSQNDLKFLDTKKINKNKDNNKKLTSNMFCHYDEFLPLIKNMLEENSDDIVIIGSKTIDETNLSVFSKKFLENTYILSNSKIKHKRIFNIYIDDFLWIGNNLYQRDGNFIIKKNDKKIKEIIKDKLNSYFLEEIKEIFPEYNEGLSELNQELKELKSKKSNLPTKKEIDKQIRDINTEKNKLYGIKTKYSSKVRKKIDKFEQDENEEALKEYPDYLRNREQIMNYSKNVSELKDKIKEVEKIEEKIKMLLSERGKLLPENIINKIEPFEKELEKLRRIKI